MRLLGKRFAVLLIFSLTIVAILAGVAYASWTDSVEVDIETSTWNYHFYNVSVSPDPDGRGVVLYTFIGDDIDVTLRKIAMGEHPTLTMIYKNDSSIPIKIDNITITPRYNRNKVFDGDLVDIEVSAKKTTNSSYTLNEDKTFNGWIADENARSYTTNLGVGDDLIIYIEVDRDSLPATGNVKKIGFLFLVTIEYSAQ